MVYEYVIGVGVVLLAAYFLIPNFKSAIDNVLAGTGGILVNASTSGSSNNAPQTVGVVQSTQSPTLGTPQVTNVAPSSSGNNTVVNNVFTGQESASGTPVVQIPTTGQTFALPPGLQLSNPSNNVINNVPTGQESASGTPVVQIPTTGQTFALPPGPQLTYVPINSMAS